MYVSAEEKIKVEARSNMSLVADVRISGCGLFDSAIVDV